MPLAWKTWSVRSRSGSFGESSCISWTPLYSSGLAKEEFSSRRTAPANDEIWWQHKQSAESSGLSSKSEKRLPKGKRGWGRQWFHTMSSQNHNFFMQQDTVSELLCHRQSIQKQYSRSEASRASLNKRSLNSRGAQHGQQWGGNASCSAFPHLTCGWKKHLEKMKDKAKDVDIVIVG